MNETNKEIKRVCEQAIADAKQKAGKNMKQEEIEKLLATSHQVASTPEDAVKVKIDLDRPIQLLHNTGTLVTVLANHIRLNRCNQGALLSVTFPDGDTALYMLTPGTDIAYAVDRCDVHVPSFSVRNVPEVKTETLFLNYYKNGDGQDMDVLEHFPSRGIADDNNIFGTRDFCVRLELTSTDGVWSAKASIEHQ